MSAPSQRRGRHKSKTGISIIFLDIDGVVLPDNAWHQTENAEAYEQMQLRALERKGSRHLLDTLSAVTFDAEAIARVVRLAERTRSYVVIHSNWRHTVGEEFTRDKLTDQGIPRRLFHQDFATPKVGRRGDSKAAEISLWLNEHRITPSPVRPDWADSDEYGEALDQFQRDYVATGVKYVVLEDEVVDMWNHPLVVCDFKTGFTPTAYAVAMRFMGGTDADMGVHAIADADLKRVRAAWKGLPMAEATWLQRPHWATGKAPADALRGSQGDRTWFWRQLAEDTQPQELPSLSTHRLG